MINSTGRGFSVLVANDHEWTARSLETILSAQGHTVIRAFTATQALERAVQANPDAVILDVQLPDSDGMSLCRAIRTAPTLGPSIPVFLTTAGPSGRQERLAAYQAGAWEFFGQPLDGETLLLKLGVYLEAKAVADALRRDSLVDAATGLYSRVGVLRRGEELAADATRRGQALTCVVLQLVIAELQAAVAAAESLGKEIATLLRSAGRSADAIGRVGTLEFAVIAAGTDRNAAASLVHRLNEAARAALSGRANGSEPIFRAAVCTVDNPASETIDAWSMLERAEAALRAEGAGQTLILPGSV
ncbi:MAG: response regulator [Gemmatimonadales bacterium]